MAATTTRRVGAILIVLVLASALTATPGRGAAAQATAHGDGGRLTNLAHLDFLHDTVAPPPQAGHDTYRLDERPEVGVVWTYAEPTGDGTYERIGGGTYDPATDTWGQGAFNADDISRAAVVYLRHWRQVGDAHSRGRARQLLRGLTYLQTIDGPNRGNVVLWMQPDGTLTRSADPPDSPDPSDSGASYWLARTIWALGEGYEAFRDHDPAFAAFLRGRLDLAIAAVERQVLVRHGERRTVDGLRWPDWLIADGADASSEAVYGLTAYVRAGGGARASRPLRQLADGIAELQTGTPYRWPYDAILPWAGSRSVWHGWGDQMAGALATAGDVTGTRRWVATAARETARFTPHLLVQGGPDNGWLPAPVDRSQIAYGADATLQNLLRAADATGRRGFRQLAGVAAAWYFGNNPAGAQMYDPATGRTFDGVNGDGTVNRNSGAESTIHGLLSMLALDAHPRVAAAAQVADRAAQVTWTLVEAEAGTTRDGAVVVTPDDAWTGESQWSGGAYVELPPGAGLDLPTDLPVDGRYVLSDVLHRREARRQAAGLRHRIDGVPAGIQWHGGAGDQGVTPWPGFLDVGTSTVRRAVDAGPAEITVRALGTQPAELDALLVQPEVEWLVLEGEGRAQAVLRSFARRTATRAVTVPGGGHVIALAYDSTGRLVGRVVSSDGTVAAPVAPGGFTVVRTR